MNSSYDYTEETQKVGIIIPTYNRVTYLKEAVDSALGQNYRNVEIIVMDNHSDDCTSQYMATVADSKVRYHVNEINVGLAENVNIGIGLLSEDIEWCTVLCDDDFLDPNFVSEMIRTAAVSSAKTIVHSSTIFVDENGKPLRSSKPAPAEESASEFVKTRAEFERERYLTGILFSRRLFTEMGGYPKFRTGMAADDGLVFAMALRDRLVYSERGVVFVRIHDGSESYALESLRNHLLSLQDYKEYCVSLAEVQGIMDAKEYGILVKRAEWHATEMSARIWLDRLRKLMKQDSRHASAEVISLYKMGLDRDLLLPTRVRMSSFLSVYLGISPEKIGIYRNVWRQIAKMKKLVKHVTC